MFVVVLCVSFCVCLYCSAVCICSVICCVVLCWIDLCCVFLNFVMFWCVSPIWEYDNVNRCCFVSLVVSNICVGRVRSHMFVRFCISLFLPLPWSARMCSGMTRVASFVFGVCYVCFVCVGFSLFVMDCYVALCFVLCCFSWCWCCSVLLL